MTPHEANALVAYLEQALHIARRILAELDKQDDDLIGDANGDPN